MKLSTIVLTFKHTRSIIIIGDNPGSKSNSNLSKSPARGFLLNYLSYIARLMSHALGIEGGRVASIVGEPFLFLKKYHSPPARPTPAII